MMTPEEKARERYPKNVHQGTSADIKDRYGNIIIPGRSDPTDYNAPLREAFLEGYNEASCENCVKVPGYVARSADEDFLCWYSDKPVPSKEMPGCWIVPHPLTNWVKLPEDAWPDLKPEHGPIEVDLILKRR